ncbi:hypothetical protein ACFQAT_18605 [Undibacterium arcticum]|uniref:Uncharacterized protein n=1 Tax=Undibacterium arcticum TaxID=1762892 RepID=A0ABV7F7T0_9BURK
MSNIQSAKKSVQLELDQAKQGRDYYQSRIDALEKALAQLTSVDTAAATGTRVTRESAEKKPLGKKATPARLAKSKGSSAKFPSTGGDFWIDLITDQPQSAADILNAAFTKLAITPTKELKQKLGARMTAALASLIGSKQIKDSGARRERRFFK